MPADALICATSQSKQLYFRQHAAFQLSGWLYDHLRSSWDALISMLPEAASCWTSAAHVYLVSSSHSDYKAAAGSRLSDWAKSLPAFNLLLWYCLLWVITAVPNQLALTCIYKKLNKKGKKIMKSITLIPWLCKRFYLFLPHTHNTIFVSSLMYSFKLDCGDMTF